MDIGLFQQEGFPDLGAKTDPVDGCDAKPRQDFRCHHGAVDTDLVIHDPVDYDHRGAQLINAASSKRKTYDEPFLQAKQAPRVSLAPEFERILKKNQEAWSNFNRLAPSYRKNYVAWLQSAKKPETREKRLKELIRTLEQDKKLGMK